MQDKGIRYRSARGSMGPNAKLGPSRNAFTGVVISMRHRFHALCPYFAMFPESFASTWIVRLTKPGEIVLDPFSGRGTTAFQALLLHRRAIACDVNDVAACLTRRKTSPPPFSVLRRHITH